MTAHDIAVIGIDCRFPKAPDAAALWRLLLAGAEGIDVVPSDRWDAADLESAGTLNHHTGGFLSDADAFDNDFFGIPPREAAAMDPQQRLLLQTTWRALENATLDPRRQASSNTGVFVGLMANEWAQINFRDYRHITAQDGSGNGYFMTANRVSYQFDFKGPSLAVDTACSSSLVAVHLATQALRTGECDQAIAAGVNLTLTPAINVFYTQAGLAAPDGRCKPFSGAADGIGRGEGVAAVVLRRLDDAVAAGLPIWAVIKGSAVNSDGKSNGITAPSRWSQQQVVASAYRNAGITPAAVDFLEAHGTGTVLGDMIETKALGHNFRSRRDRPCSIGSIKGNLGHTEGAAGIAGLIKTILSLHHRVVPPSRFADSENSELRLADHGLRLLTTALDLPEGEVVAGLSSFGMGGTNCHMVVASAPERDSPPVTGGSGIVTLSSNTEEGVRRNALLLADDFEGSDVPIDQLCWSSNQIKASGKVRAAFVTVDRADAVARLRGELAISQANGMGAGWLFNGQGTQFVGMGTLVLDGPQVLREAFEQVETALLPLLGLRIREVMADDRIDATEFAQPAIFAIQYAQAKALSDLGAEPAWLVGHSIGEFAAAVAAEVLTFEDAARLVAARGRLMQGLDVRGGMLAVRASPPELSGCTLDIAAVNGPRDVVVAGPEDALADLATELEGRGHTTRRLNTSHAFHSSLMEPMTAEFAEIAAGCSFSPAVFPIYSTVRGRLLEDDELMDAGYWVEHIRSTVRFADAATAALATGSPCVVELGAKRVLSPMIPRLIPDAPATTCLADGFAEAIAELSRRGLNPHWKKLYPKASRFSHRLSGYAFDDSHRFWSKHHDLPQAPATAASTSQDSTMDNLIALFREQAAVLAAYGKVNLDTEAPAAPPVRAAQPEPDRVAEIVFGEVARISGFPLAKLRPNQSFSDELGFDSIMVADLFNGLKRRLPAQPIDPAALASARTVADVIALAGGRSAELTTTAAAVVAPQSKIGEFEEVKALKDRFAMLSAVGIENPYFLVNDGVTRDTSIINGQSTVNFSSYNYLGMSGHPAVAEAVADAVARWGSSCSAARLLSGEKPVHRELELELARLLGTEDAMALVSGHATNVTVIGHLLGEGDLVIHDSLAHDSIMQGCKLSGATRRPFPHNDYAALDDLLTHIRHQYRRVLIVIEGIYSQDGDIPDLPAFIEVKRKHQALLMIDEAHSIGVLGATGAGIGEHFGVDREDVELWSGTMSKALAGCGGYVGGSHELIEFLKYTTPGFVYSVGMPPPTAAASLAAIRTMRAEPEHLRRLRSRSALFLQLAREAGIDTGDSNDTPVIPCIVGSSVNALRLSDALLKRGINANPILYPAVPEDGARLRFFVTACHTEDQIRNSVKVLAEEIALLNHGT